MGNNTSLEAVKQELCKIHPSIPSRVKWDGDKVITDKWVKTRPVLIEAQDNENASINIDESAHTNNKAKEYNDMLEELDAVNRHLQTRLIPLNECQWALNTLSEEVELNKRSLGHKLYGTKFQSKYISQDADILPNPSFESGVIKLQEGKASELDDEERIVVSCFKKVNIDEGANNTENELISMAR
mmetsp:Transcript_46278/g.90351  ORF Transcript_46278/g.90351 Transcript_46278/m.90351 type:complete len:186 (+) Transcript_46278:894-1451(+)